jgi:integrase
MGSRRFLADELADRLGDGMATTTRRRAAARLHLLTARQVQAAADGDHADGGGLLLRIRGDSAAWVFRYTAPSGNRREMGLGVCFRGSTAQAGDAVASARRQAVDCRNFLAAGEDPMQVRAQRRAAAAEADAARKAEKTRERQTLARCARDYHERVIEPVKTAKHSAQWISSLENHIPASLWHKPIAEVEAPELLRALSNITAHERARRVEAGTRVTETVKRIRQRLDAVFEDAIFHKRCSSNPAAAVRRKMRESMPKKKAGRFAALPYKEAPAFMARLREASGVAARCLELAVLTASRTQEVLGAVWSEFDLESRTWLVPPERMKASGKDEPESHLVHLSDRALAVLQGQAKLHASLVFPSTVKADAGQSNMAMLAVLNRLGVREQTTVHGLCRATFSTWAYETAAARADVIEACLAHREADKVKAAYNRAQFNEERRALLSAWADYLEHPPAAVLPLAAKSAASPRGLRCRKGTASELQTERVSGI